LFRDLLLKDRSIRRYKQDHKVSKETLLELVDMGRLSSSGGNRQPLKYMLSWEGERNALVFKHIGLAGPPKDGERPSAYIIILMDTQLGGYGGSGVDHGIAAHSILLGATEMGLGGCMIGMVNRKGLQQALKIPERYEILLVISIGKPDEKFVLVDVEEKDTVNTRGWWDEQGMRYVPKRKMADIIVE